MKNVAIFAAIAILMLSSADAISAPARSPAVQKEWTENITLAFAMDERDWKLGYSDKANDQYLLEFVLPGQTVENWKELITVQFIEGLQKEADAEEFAEYFANKLQKDEPKVRISVVLDTPNNTIIEWKVNGSKKNVDQDELVRFITGKQGIHVVHYAKKCTGLTDAERTKWLKFLESAKLSSTLPK